ncbi:hypothetical protein NE636_10075 [Bacteroides thetaiotaomicron]|uniref:hypothetical protein n=1 Tax=Bacteroides thetaiotaomicron TaxID=818 RepID=UPI001D05DECC|nr:hypothetical protein [Bacteroides thetaiotaomicron]MCB7382688.1 hypothetical protein [Bacteroides thetaiotaomicron]MCG4882361.1 hypothetical protein [Bacteroides thetaiotaomicron]MCQ5249161.1 hypothetical protein [Bacteroides thetaiotaomicron]MDC2231777.1 hypothetical protein [Bacteroides thetaiotaomicron]
MILLFLAVTNVTAKNTPSPRIVNIINFIRQLEPRDSKISEEVLYETVHKQVELLKKYNMRGTFLLQYDALINPRYQSLLKEEVRRGTEVGGWWEITQPHVEAAGLEWRGRYPWDWHADVGFATGYIPEEREKLVDVYMEKFKEIFGKYPASIGSWFIDAHTLEYMHEKYGIVASCNCKDQYGTDGYTLWGGYWNQAYYPSRLNGYMPAQTQEGQIPVPVFRMLGSDPIYQYDTGLGHSIQGVITLEPVYGDAGGSEKWVRRFFKSIFEDPCIGFNYTQAGQENSFTWAGMEKGLEMQFPILDSLIQTGDIRIETLEESGRWFKKKYPVTPPTSVTALTDTYDNGNRTVWFNSRFYRTNLLWNDRSIRFRDIQLFDERIESDYLKQRGTSNQCVYTTCSILDGFLWSTPDEYAAIRFYTITDGVEKEVTLKNVEVKAIKDKKMQLHCVATDQSVYTINLSEKQIEIKGKTPHTWMLKLGVATGKTLPLKVKGDDSLTGELKGIPYGIVCLKGNMKQSGNTVFLNPENNRLVVDCSFRNFK